MRAITYTNDSTSTHVSIGDVVIIEGKSGEGKTTALYRRCLHHVTEFDIDVLLVTREETVEQAVKRLDAVAIENGYSYDDASRIKIVKADIMDLVDSIVIEHGADNHIIAIDGPNAGIAYDIDVLLDLADKHDVGLIIVSQTHRSKV